MQTVSFLQKGEGKDLLLLHGYLSSKEAFANQIAYFSKFYKVTAIDFLGFGQSEKLPAPFSVDDYAAWLWRVMESLGLKSPHIIAHSFGCRVAVKLASERQNAFDKILLTGPAGIILKRGFSYHFKVKTYRFMKKIAPKFAERKFGSKEYRSLDPIMKESYKKIVNEDLSSAAKRVKNQVLIVEGTHDRTTTVQEAEVYLQSFPRAKLEMIEGGHFSFVENPLVFNFLAEEFFYG